MTQSTEFQPSKNRDQGETCANCPHFTDFHDVRSRGWCQAFDKPARTYHPRTATCDATIELQSQQQSTTVSEVSAPQAPQTASELYLSSVDSEIPSPPVIHEYVLTLWNGKYEEDYEEDGTCHQVVADPYTVKATFPHKPTEQDWEHWLSPWTKAGFQVLSSPSPCYYGDYDEF